MVDIDTLENSRECNINGLPAIMGEAKGRMYLCWTLDPENSCVIEYTAGAVSEEDLFHMAESVELPQSEE